MAARGSGGIVNVGSMAGQIGLAGGIAYSATKAALVGPPWPARYSEKLVLRRLRQSGI
jgi:NAD(P)-dependent dehydrogenase (short-subunit alcohol dehydrogenase family)